jgi:hypothetical protein
VDIKTYGRSLLVLSTSKGFFYQDVWSVVLLVLSTSKGFSYQDVWLVVLLVLGQYQKYDQLFVLIKEWWDVARDPPCQTILSWRHIIGMRGKTRQWYKHTLYVISLSNISMKTNFKQIIRVEIRLTNLYNTLREQDVVSPHRGDKRMARRCTRRSLPNYFDMTSYHWNNASSLKPLGQLKPNCPGMIIGRFSTNCMFFMPIYCPSGFIEEALWNIFPMGSNVKLSPAVAAILNLPTQDLKEP